MVKISARVFLLIDIAFVIGQFNINGQSTMRVMTDQPISRNLTLLSLLSYTSQSSMNINQTLLPLFTSIQSNNNTSMMMTATISTTLTSGLTAVPSITAISTKVSSWTATNNIPITSSNATVLISSSTNSSANTSPSFITAIAMNASSSGMITSSAIPSFNATVTVSSSPTTTKRLLINTYASPSTVSSNLTRITSTMINTVPSSPQYSTPFKNQATKCQQYITLVVVVGHILLFIFPFH